MPHCLRLLILSYYQLGHIIGSAWQLMDKALELNLEHRPAWLVQVPGELQTHPRTSLKKPRVSLLGLQIFRDFVMIFLSNI